ncbi:MAG: hypothetical protein M3290_13895 [Actinomycetota bacterium]|nr:hypothetical protein [Actinomycetota bacterium]
MSDLWERFGIVAGAAALIVLGTVAATLAGGAPIPQRLEVAAAAIVVQLYAAFGAAYDRAWSVGLAIIDAGALVVAFRIHHTTDKLLLGIPAIASLALAVIHAMTMDAEAQPLAEPSPDAT